MARKLEKGKAMTGAVSVAAGLAFLVAVAVALMSGKPATSPDAGVAPAQSPAAGAGQPPPAAATSEPPSAAAGSSAKPPPEIRAALDDQRPPAGSLVTRVYFPGGSAALDDGGRATVAQAARTLSAGLAARIALSGYVDASGSAAANAELAKQRARAVRDALLAAGVPADAMELRKPQQITAEGSADEARRVDLVLLR